MAEQTVAVQGLDAVSFLGLVFLVIIIILLAFILGELRRSR